MPEPIVSPSAAAPVDTATPAAAPTPPSPAPASEPTVSWSDRMVKMMTAPVVEDESWMKTLTDWLVDPAAIDSCRRAPASYPGSADP